MIKYTVCFSVLMFLLSACYNEEKIIPAPTIYLEMPIGGFDMDRDSAFSIVPKITYDTNSSYAWLYDNEVFSDKKDLHFINQKMGSYQYVFSVTTPSGTDSYDVTLNAIDYHSFENFKELNTSGYNNTPSSGYFQFKTALFPTSNKDNDVYNWSGFAMSKNTNKTTADSTNQFSVYDVSGAQKSKVFMVYKQVEGVDSRVSFSDNGLHRIKSIDVQNSTIAYFAMKSSKGLNYSAKTDYFLLTLIGYGEGDVEVGRVEVYLANYQFTTNRQKFILESWKTVDLTSLGEIKTLGFKLSSSVDGNSEKYIPPYCCIDNLKVAS